MEENENLERYNEIMESLKDPFVNLYVNQKQHSKVLKMLMVGFALLLALVLSAGYLFYAQSKASCRSQNEFRRLDKERWTSIVQKFTPPNQTPTEKARAQAFLDFLQQADAPRRC